MNRAVPCRRTHIFGHNIAFAGALVAVSGYCPSSASNAVAGPTEALNLNVDSQVTCRGTRGCSFNAYSEDLNEDLAVENIPTMDLNEDLAVETIPSMVKCLAATFAGSVLAIVGMFIERKKDIKRLIVAKHRDMQNNQKAFVGPECAEKQLHGHGRAQNRTEGPKNDQDKCGGLQYQVGRTERHVKSILNKLTRERFDTLYGQLLACCEGHQAESRTEIAAIIAREVFSKATVQHNFVEMYADLCARINADLQEKHTEVNFKRVLLNQCQESFAKYLETPRFDDTLDYDGHVEALLKYKTKMLGNVRLIGHLLRHRMLASKIIFTCTDKLLEIGTPEALETLCVFLETIGAQFDDASIQNEWKGSTRLNEVFIRVELLSLDTKQTPRIRCLLKDLLDKRRRDWRDPHVAKH